MQGNLFFEQVVAFEKGVARLYDTISDEIKKEFGVFFEHMADDERRHVKIYEALAKKVQEANITIDDPEEVLYLESLDKNSIVHAGEDFFNQVKKIKNKWQVLDLAERVEREAVQYIYELQRLFPNFAEEEVAILLKEEKKHLQMVLNKKEAGMYTFLGL